MTAAGYTIHYRQAGKSDIPAMARIRAGEWESEDYWLGAAAAIMLRPLWPFLISGVLLVLVAFFDRSHAIRKNQ